MFDWVDSYQGLDLIFLLCAVFGGGLFVLRVILLVFGAGFDADGDAGGHGGVGDVGDSDVHDGHFHDTDASFKLLSMQGVTSFFMMFGLVGIAMRQGSHFGPAASIAAALGAGLFSMWLTAIIFKAALRLQTSGTIDMHNAIGTEGVVYLTVPPKGMGKVQVEVQGRLREVEAITESGVEIPTSTRVRVTRVVTGNVLVVEKA